MVSDAAGPSSDPCSLAGLRSTGEEKAAVKVIVVSGEKFQIQEADLTG